MRAIAGRTDKMSSLVGILERDRLGWSGYTRLSGLFVRYWIWDELGRFKPGQKIRIVIEVLDD